MKLLIVFIFILISLNIISGQSNKNLNNYYRNLYQAETFIVENKYDSALVYYERSFSMYRENFIPDLNNALICAIESDRFELVGGYIKELLLQGVSQSYFEKKYYFKQFVKSSIFSALYEPIHSNIDSFKVKLIDTLIIRDQYPRRNNLKDSILKVDMENEQILEEYIFNNSVFPNSYEIGVQIINDTIIYDSPISTLLVHQTRDNPLKYSNVFLLNLDKKTISPRDFFSYSKFFYGGDKNNSLGCDEGTFLIIEYYGNEAYTCCCELEKLINENRKKYYLESLDDAIKKYRFMKTTSLPFMIENYLQGYFTILDSQFVIDRKNKRKADPNYVKFIEKKR